MAQPEFTHIHCSSRYDRSAASLEAAVDHWREQSSIITLTEVANDKRGATLAEAGWGYARSRRDAGRDECAVCFNKSFWGLEWQNAVKLNTAGRVFAGPVCCCDAILKRLGTGHRMLVSVTHMPSGVEGSGGAHWNTHKSFWEARRAAYLSSLRNWANHIHNLKNTKKPDAILVVCDWNLNLKKTWVRELLHDRFGQGYRQAWVRFPTSGGSLTGGPVAPLGSPGKATGDRIIDGTLYNGVKVTTEPNLMLRGPSSDHRPYKEAFQFLAPSEVPPPDDPGNGDVQQGDHWWGFGDYLDDEIYQLDFEVEDA